MAWSGLGMGMFSTTDTAEFDSYCDYLKSFGILDIRVDIPDYQNAAWLARSKAAVIRAVAKGMRVVWGISSNIGNSAEYVITADNWSAYSDASLAAALWAEQNGVYEFQIGNEAEGSNDGTTLTDGDLRTNLKTLATAVQAVYTIGNVSYSHTTGQTAAWIALGRGDIDIIALNIYRGGGGSYDSGWITASTALIAEFGSSNCEITEFNLSYTSLADFSTDEQIQTRELAVMQKKIQELGFTRAFCYVWEHSTKGVISDYGQEPRLIWNTLSNNVGRRWFIN